MNTSFWMSLRKQHRRLVYIFLASTVATGIVALAAIAKSPVLEQPVPTITEEVGGVQVALPDWDHISLSTLPPVLTGGEIGPDWNELIGYDLSRVWSPGDAVGDVIKLGDISEGFGAEQFSVNDIATLIGLDIPVDDIALSEFALVGDQSLAELAAAVPGLADIKIEDIPPIDALVTGIGEGAWVEETLGTFVNGNAIAQDLKLDGLGELPNLDLSQYSLADIPGLSEVPLEDFARWEDQFPSDVPGLVNVAFSQMPNGIGNAGVIARVDTVMGTAEAEYQRTVSGSTEVGFSYPCNKHTQGGDTEACAHIELDDIENFGATLQLPFEGRAWVSGATQKVPGGHGALKSMFGGKEPTGRHPFSDSFKVVIGETDETTDTFQTLLYFRVCKTFLGCSPYGIGPVPFLTFKRDDYIILGPPDFGGGAGSIGSSTSPGNAPGGLNSGSTETGGIVNNGVETIGAASETLSSSSGGSSGHSSTSTNGSNSSAEFDGLTAEEYAQQSGIESLACTGEEVDGINLDVLADAIAQELNIPDGYQGVSASTGNAVTLGRYGYLSNSQWVQDWVSRVAGGPDWLEQLANGHVPSRAEMAQYFPPVLQDEIFKAEMRSYLAIATEEVDPQTEKAFKGSRLVERVAQLSFGGVGSVIDSQAKGQGPSLYRHGVKVRKYYYGQGGQSQCSINGFIRQEGNRNG